MPTSNLILIKKRSISTCLLYQEVDLRDGGGIVEKKRREKKRKKKTREVDGSSLLSNCVAFTESDY
jgi:hypothetical protein